MKHFQRLLIANRGEIAVRIIKTAKSMGLYCIAVYSDADEFARHVQEADLAVRIGPNQVDQSYLNIDAIIKAATITEAQAIHPGYGFLSENADFARACQQNKFVFIGPSAETIQQMGDKRQAKLLMEKSNVPTVPGYNGKPQDIKSLNAAAEKMGYPIMIKACAGGGGRGMRLVETKNQLPELITSAQSEAKSAFGDERIILEKAIQNARHIEIQIFADQHGHFVHLGERDCSIQRRHQKLVEESPSSFLDQALRQKMTTAAINAAKTCDYTGAGTVEFLVDEHGEFYFLEMNTRLQVEHPVTEMVTGLDLVEWQLKIADGECLPLKQNEVSFNGHAIEVRLYAEDPTQNFLPQTGQINNFKIPTSDYLRADHMLYPGLGVSSFYDPMLGKLIAWGVSREHANERLSSMISNTHLIGLNCNLALIQQIIDHPDFRKGLVTTGFMEKSFANFQLKPPSLECWALAAVLLQRQQYNGYEQQRWAGTYMPQLPSYIKLSSNNELRQIRILFDQQTSTYQIEDQDQSSLQISLLNIAEQHCSYQIGSVTKKAYFVQHPDQIDLFHHQSALKFINQSKDAASKAEQHGNGQITAIMDGAIVNIKVAVGEQVQQGQTLLLLEAMKMEHPVKANSGGMIESISVSVGDQVNAEQLLIQINPDCKTEIS